VHEDELLARIETALKLKRTVDRIVGGLRAQRALCQVCTPSQQF
jgi:hypothetical protein